MIRKALNEWKRTRYDQLSDTLIIERSVVAANGPWMVTSQRQAPTDWNRGAQELAGCAPIDCPFEWETTPEGPQRGDGSLPPSCPDDNCPESSNPDQADSDVDGVGDACDACPADPGPAENSGCPEAIPTVSEWGLVIMALLLLTAWKVYFGRRRAIGG